MIIYLDQNKWIELSQIVHGKTNTSEAKKIIDEIKTMIDCGICIFPLSSNHYIETARISNSGRKARLGSVMWEFSKGFTFASLENIVVHELETALEKIFPHVKISPFNLMGHGISHAFGENPPPLPKYPTDLEEDFERSCLTGQSKYIYEESQGFESMKFRQKFKNHLDTLHKKMSILPQNKWEDALYGIVLSDIVEPLAQVMLKHKISENFLNIDNIRIIVDNMPSRNLELHLHKQILKNIKYKAKLSDLEDWAGIGVYSQYCDVVVCEKHMANMLKRDKFVTKARVETKLKNIFQTV